MVIGRVKDGQKSTQSSYIYLTSKSEKNSDLINQKYHENMGTYYRTILTVWIL